MKTPISLTINRSGKFSAHPDQQTANQCGKVAQENYEYFCSITATNKGLTADGYVMENAWTAAYFDRYKDYKDEPIPSCEQMAMDFIEYFRNLFKTSPELKGVDLRRIYIRIHGSPVSFIEGEWVKPQYLNV